MAAPQAGSTPSTADAADDCHGHGTHVAGTVGGTSFGVAKAVQLVGVRVLNCSGSGTNSQVIAGVDWVTQNAIKPAVANMSLGGGANTAIDTAVANSINSGVSYSIAAGNSNGANACSFSPARVGAAITVGSTTQTDARSSFSNIGTCLDIFAPGSSITSAWSTSNTATNTISGTSMATPHVAGAAALVLSANPSFTPTQVRDRLVADSTTGVVTGAGTGSPNRLLFVNNGTPPPPPPPPPGTVFSDNFETSLGWTTNPSGTDTATTGAWQRGDPAGTSSGITLQLGTTTSGTNDLVTGAAAGTSAGAFDVDGGTTSVSVAVDHAADRNHHPVVRVVPGAPQQRQQRRLLPGERGLWQHHHGGVQPGRCGHQPRRRLGDRDNPTRLGVCAGPTCRSTFVDLSRNGSKQYCTRACAHRASVAAYRSRQSPR